MRTPPTIIELIAGLALVFALGGCGGSAILKGSGTPTEAPAGYLAQCAQHPELENCTP